MMRFSRFVLASLLGLLSLTLLVVAITTPDVVRLIVGLIGFRIWAAGLALAGALLLVGLAVAHLARSRMLRRTGLVVALLAVVAAVLFWRHSPSYAIEPVSYASGDVVLAGDFYRPQTPPPWTGIVLVHGSAPFPRTFYDVWADFLARNGAAVLLADKRGVGDSGGHFQSDNNASVENLSLLAQDVCKGIEYLSSRGELDMNRIGLYGISQAGWVGVLAARKCSGIGFIIMNSGPVVSVGEEGAWSKMRGDDQRAAEVSRDEAERQIMEIEPTGYDPRVDLDSLDIPGLWLFGAEDNSIPSAKSIAVLDQMIFSGKPFEYRRYAGVGHILIGGRGSRAAFRMPQESWEDVAVWLEGLSR